jgi:hypothetical protein
VRESALLPCILLAACAAPEPNAPPRAVAVPVPLSAERIGVLGSAAALRAGAVLYDGGAAVDLGDGRLFRAFGDTFFGERGTPGNPDLVRFFGPAGPGEGLRSISGAVTHTALLSARADFAGEGADARFLGAAGGPVERGALIPAPEEEAAGDPGSLRVWPMHGVSDGKTLLLFYVVIRILKDAPPPFNFEALGVGLAEGDPEHPPLRPVRGPLGWRVFPREAPPFGAWVVQADMGITPGFDYCYGTRGEEGANRCYVARVPHLGGRDPSAWRFFDGKDWVEDPARAAPILEGVPGELSVEWNPALRAFLAVHVLPLSREVVAQASERPEGPFGPPTVLFRVPPPASGDQGWVYAAKQQPALDPARPRVLLVSCVDTREGVPALWRVILP